LREFHLVSCGKLKGFVFFDCLGADEQLCGYSRHRNSYKHRGPKGLQLEIDKDLSRLWIRNLGRDDRLISSLSKESRYPFLDFDFISFVNRTPLGLVCDMTKPPGVGDKQILREAAAVLGLRISSKFEKRAMQFGSRISHLTPRKVGGHVAFQGFSEGKKK
jgi:asparagine synthetase B (glutamine-hydrolysing)